MRALRWNVALGVVVALAGASCSGAKVNRPSAGPAPVTQTAASPEGSPAASPEGSPSAPPPTGSPLGPLTCTQSAGTLPGGVLVLQRVAAASHPGYDRVVFAFTSVGQVRMGADATFTVAPAQPPFVEDGSGAAIAVAGASFLSVRFHDAYGYDPVNTPPKATYTGPIDLRPGLARVMQVRRTGDFEGQLGWVLGLSQHACWRVAQTTNPTTLIVDIPTA